jgi:hypothetical protein
MKTDYYNWKQIFKDKSDKELYEIFIGYITFPNEVVQLAKDELDSRNFDFNNIDIIKKGWQLSRLLEEQNFRNQEVMYNKYTFITLREYILLNIAFAFLLIVCCWFKNLPIKEVIIYYLVTLTISTIGTLLNNFYDFRKQRKYNERLTIQIDDLSAFLKEKGILEVGSTYNHYLKQEKQKQLTIISYSRKIWVVILMFFIITFIIKSIN